MWDPIFIRQRIPEWGGREVCRGLGVWRSNSGCRTDDKLGLRLFSFLSTSFTSLLAFFFSFLSDFIFTSNFSGIVTYTLRIRNLLRLGKVLRILSFTPRPWLCLHALSADVLSTSMNNL